MNCIDYLIDDSNLISARTKQVKLRLLDKTKLAAEKDQVGYLNVSLPVILVIIAGIIKYYIRKKKYQG